MTSETKKRVRKKPEVRRAELVDAAVKLFIKKGYQATTVDDIVAAAGASKGTFYLYFDSKPQVFTAIGERLMDLYIAEARKVVTSDDDPKTIIRKLLEAVFKIYGRNRRLVRMLHAAGPDSDHDRMHEAGMNRLKPVLGPILEEGVRRGQFDIRDMDGTMEVIPVLVEGIGHLMISPGSPLTEESAREIGTRLMDSLLGIS